MNIDLEKYAFEQKVKISDHDLWKVKCSRLETFANTEIYTNKLCHPIYISQHIRYIAIIENILRIFCVNGYI